MTHTLGYITDSRRKVVPVKKYVAQPSLSSGTIEKYEGRCITIMVHNVHDYQEGVHLHELKLTAHVTPRARLSRTIGKDDWIHKYMLS